MEAKRDVLTVREHLFRSYASLGCAHSALRSGRTEYAKIDYIIRSKLFRGLCTGTMSVRSLYDDERILLSSCRCCVYCGNSERLTLDHIFPQAKYTGDHGYNLIAACSVCNSSKGKKDLIIWYRQRDSFPPLLLLRRYLKLAILISEQAGVSHILTHDVPEDSLPFDIAEIPLKLPPLKALTL